MLHSENQRRRFHQKGGRDASLKCLDSRPLKGRPVNQGVSFFRIQYLKSNVASLLLMLTPSNLWKCSPLPFCVLVLFMLVRRGWKHFGAQSRGLRKTGGQTRAWALADSSGAAGIRLAPRFPLHVRTELQVSGHSGGLQGSAVLFCHPDQNLDQDPSPCLSWGVCRLTDGGARWTFEGEFRWHYDWLWADGGPWALGAWDMSLPMISFTAGKRQKNNNLNCFY